MSVDLDHLYRALARDGATAPMESPGELRRTGDRRDRTRLAVAATTVVVLLGAAAVGANALAGGMAGPAPADSAAPTHSAAPTAAASSQPPSGPASAPAAKVITSIPDSAFLRIADLAADPATKWGTTLRLHRLCGGRHDSESAVTARRSREYIASIVPPGEPAGTAPAPEEVRQTITAYRPGGASAFVAEVRAMVAGCPAEKHPDLGQVSYRLRPGPAGADESVVVEMTFQPKGVEGGSGGGTAVHRMAVVRVGDVVTIVDDQGWEGSGSAAPEVLDGFVRTAVTRIRAWLK